MAKNCTDEKKKKKKREEENTRISYLVKNVKDTIGFLRSNDQDYQRVLL